MSRGACDREGMKASAFASRVQSGSIPGLGEVWLELGEQGELVRVWLPGLDRRQPEVPAGAHKLDERIERALRLYVQGSPEALTGLALAPARTPFAAAVRKAMQDVPWGAVMTYGEIARAIGRPGAARAVGRACATNPLPLLVPCHRVVGRRGPGGFGLGLEAKRILLEIEGVEIDHLAEGHGATDRANSAARGP